MHKHPFRLAVCLIGIVTNACSTLDAPTTAPLPTSTPSLNASLWVDYPMLPADHPQAVNVTVYDPNGQPIAEAIVIGEYETPAGKKPLSFPRTDADGQTRIPLELPTVQHLQTLTITVSVASGGRWGQVVTTFEVYPQDQAQANK